MIGDTKTEKYSQIRLFCQLAIALKTFNMTLVLCDTHPHYFL